MAGEIGCVRLLLEAGAAVNQADAEGFTPLYVACQEGHFECAQLLRDAGAAANQAPQNGATPLYIACQKEGRATSRYCRGQI